MKRKKLSPLAAAIVEGLNEAISYVNGVHVKGLRAVEVPESKKKNSIEQEEIAITFRIPLSKIKDSKKTATALDEALQGVLERYCDGVVILSKKEYDNIMENLLIRSNPEDYRKLIESIHQLESSGKNKC